METTAFDPPAPPPSLAAGGVSPVAEGQQHSWVQQDLLVHCVLKQWGTDGGDELVCPV